MRMINVAIIFTVLIMAGCDRGQNEGPRKVVQFKNLPPENNVVPIIPRHRLAERRQEFNTKIVKNVKSGKPWLEAPADIFQTIEYDSPVGKLKAYLTPNPDDHQKHPAIIWITGGDCNTLGDVWTPQSPANDQSASAYRKAGIVMMFPSLRGGNQNPGVHECFYGEVDDILAARDYLSKLDYVDPQRIYLGGHSSGGTMVLLVAECTTKFRAIFCFGPGDTMEGFPDSFIVYDRGDYEEHHLRSPIKWLDSIYTKTFIFEGNKASRANVLAVNRISYESPSDLIKCIPVSGANHFTVLDPVNRVIANKILQDTGSECNIRIRYNDLDNLFEESPK